MVQYLCQEVCSRPCSAPSYIPPKLVGKRRDLQERVSDIFSAKRYGVPRILWRCNGHHQPAPRFDQTKSQR